MGSVVCTHIVAKRRGSRCRGHSIPSPYVHTTTRQHKLNSTHSSLGVHPELGSGNDFQGLLKRERTNDPERGTFVFIYVYLSKLNGIVLNGVSKLHTATFKRQVTTKTLVSHRGCRIIRVSTNMGPPSPATRSPRGSFFNPLGIRDTL